MATLVEINVWRAGLANATTMDLTLEAYSGTQLPTYVDLSLTDSRIIVNDSPTLVRDGDEQYVSSYGFFLAGGYLAVGLADDLNAGILTEISLDALRLTTTTTLMGIVTPHSNIQRVFVSSIRVAWKATDTAVGNLVDTLGVTGSTSSIPGMTSAIASLPASSSRLSKGSIPGIVIGSVAVILLPILGLGFYVRRPRHSLKAARLGTPEVEGGKPELDGLEVEQPFLIPDKLDCPPVVIPELPTHDRPFEAG